MGFLYAKCCLVIVKMFALRRCRAFTLIELMVVIGIIGILASLLLPALSSAMKEAKGIQCRGNLKQIGYAAQMYEMDYDSYMVSAWANDTSVFYDGLAVYLGMKPLGVNGGRNPTTWRVKPKPSVCSCLE